MVRIQWRPEVFSRYRRGGVGRRRRSARRRRPGIAGDRPRADDDTAVVRTTLTTARDRPQ
jgi:hypothetical protein